MSKHTETAASLPQCIVSDHWDQSTVVISCAGVIDSLTAPEVERQIASALAKNPEAMIVDLSAVDFLASCGMGVLITTQDLCSPTTRFAVVADGPATSRPMQLIGLTEIITVRTTMDEARQELSS